jgi:hypothetical protein
LEKQLENASEGDHLSPDRVEKDTGENSYRKQLKQNQYIFTPFTSTSNQGINETDFGKDT